MARPERFELLTVGLEIGTGRLAAQLTQVGFGYDPRLQKIDDTHSRAAWRFAALRLRVHQQGPLAAALLPFPAILCLRRYLAALHARLMFSSVESPLTTTPGG